MAASRKAVLAAAGADPALAGGAGPAGLRVRCGGAGGWAGVARGIAAAHARGAPPAEVEVEVRARGGKGGFGANLRGAGQKGQQVDNFDACRTLDGRRVRHERAEAELAQWEADEGRRALERAAEKRARDLARKGALEEEGAAVAGEWRETAERCAEGAARAVRDALGKRPATEALAERPAADAAGPVGGGSKRPRMAAWGALGDGLSSDSDSGSSSDSGSDSEGVSPVVVVEEGPSGSRPSRRS